MGVERATAGVGLALDAKGRVLVALVGLGLISSAAASGPTSGSRGDGGASVGVTGAATATAPATGTVKVGVITTCAATGTVVAVGGTGVL